MRFRSKLFCLLLCLTILLQVAPLSVLAETDQPDISVTEGCHGIDAAVPFLGTTQLIENADAVFLLESKTDTLMYAWNADKPIYPAGMVKIVTAIVAIENSNLTDAVTVKQSTLDLLSKSDRTSKLKADEVFTVEQLLHFLLMDGSNDAAVVLADHIAGSQEAFVSMMNEYVANVGCVNTVITNVHGFHNEQQVTTARDIARIIDAAIENEDFKKIFGTTKYIMEATNLSEVRTIKTSNDLMAKGPYEDSRVTGGRTGTNYEGLRCVSSTAAEGDMELICVVMGSATEFNENGIPLKIGGYAETSKLLDLGFEGFSTGQILYENQALKQVPVQNGSSMVTLTPDKAISAVIPTKKEAGVLEYRYIDVDNAFTAPITKGQHMSTLQIWYGGSCIATTELYALNDVSVNYQQIISNKKQGASVWSVLLVLILVAVAVMFAILYILRIRNIKSATRSRKAKKRIAANRRSR